MGTYNGIIEYNFDGKDSRKKVVVVIRQTLLSIKIQIKTNEITSNTIVGNLVEEMDEYILYYTYITNPKSKYSKLNPIQYGTCRLATSNPNNLIGVYWKAFCSIVFKPSFKITVSRELQLAKANSFIYFTLPGISIDSSFIQELKTWRSSDSSFDESVIDFNFEQ